MAFFEHDFSVRMRDVDANTKITNKAILGFFEDIGGLHSDKVGYGFNDIYATRLSWILLHWKIKVIKRAIYGDVIHIKTWSRYSTKFYSYRDFEMYSKNGELLVIGTSKWALLNIDSGLARLEESLISKYKPEQKSVFDELEVKKLKEPKTFSNCNEYKVLRSNIDINKHMHNLYYLDVANEVIPDDIYESEEFNNVEIMYKTGAMLGETLKSFYSNVEDEHFVTIKSEDEQTLHAIVRMY